MIGINPGWSVRRTNSEKEHYIVRRPHELGSLEESRVEYRENPIRIYRG
jgi:hypothetical protein